jgi:hypothetical protein
VDAFVHPAPPPGYTVQLLVVGPSHPHRGFAVASLMISDDAIRGSKPTSVAIAKLATMVLSETLGLELSGVVRGGIG